MVGQESVVQIKPKRAVIQGSSSSISHCKGEAGRQRDVAASSDSGSV